MPAPPINTTIALLGAEEVQAQLASLGVTGEASFATIGAAADAASTSAGVTDLTAATAGLTASMTNIGAAGQTGFAELATAAAAIGSSGGALATAEVATGDLAVAARNVGIAGEAGFAQLGAAAETVATGGGIAEAGVASAALATSVEKVGVAGEAAFAEVDEAAVKASTGGLSSLGALAQNIVGGFQSLGTTFATVGTSVLGFAGRVTGLGTNLAAMEATAVAVGSSSGGLGRIGGLSASLVGVFRNVGTALAPLGSALSTLGSSLVTLGTHVGELGTKFTGLGALLGGGVAAAFLELAKNSAEAVHSLDNQAAALGISTTKLQGLQLLAAQSGVDSDAFTTALDRMTAAVGASAEKIPGFKVQMNDAIEVIKGGTPAAASLGGGIDVIRGSMAALSDSVGGTTTVLRGNAVQTKATTDALGELGINAGQLGNLLKTPELALTTIANKLNQVQNPAEKARLAMQLFGRGWAQVIPAFTGGAAAIQTDTNQIVAMNLQIRDADKENSVAFTKSYATMVDTLTSIKNIIGSTLAPLFTGVFNSITQALGDNAAAIRQWAQGVVEAMQPAVKAFTDFVSNGDNLQTLGQTLSNIAGDIKTAFDVVKTVLSDVAAGLNAVFGTDFNAASLGAILVVGKVVGAFGLLKDIVVVVGGVYAALKETFLVVDAVLASELIPTLAAVGTAFLGAFAVPILIGLVIAAIALLAIKLFGFWDSFIAICKQVVASIGTVCQSIIDFFGNAWDAIKTAFNTAWTAIVDFISDSIGPILNMIGKIATAIGNVIKAIGSVASSAGEASMQSGGIDMAAGGSVRSQRPLVRAMLTPGEAVFDRVTAARHLPLLRSINAGQQLNYAFGGAVRHFAAGGLVEHHTVASPDSETKDKFRKGTEKKSPVDKGTIVNPGTRGDGPTSPEGAKEEKRTVKLATGGVVPWMQMAAGVSALALATGGLVQTANALPLAFSTALYFASGGDVAKENADRAEASARTRDRKEAGVASRAAKKVTEEDIRADDKASEDQLKAIYAKKKVERRAGGGWIVPGSGDSDTVPAFLTPGEFVVRKSAVQMHLPLLHAINEHRHFSLGGLIQNIAAPVLQGFSFGGMVQPLHDLTRARPVGFAGGGIVPTTTGGNHLTLVLDGTSHHASVDQSNFASLTRAARAKRVRSAGTRPSWFTG